MEKIVFKRVIDADLAATAALQMFELVMQVRGHIPAYVVSYLIPRIGFMKTISLHQTLAVRFRR
jgi:hypothetical protein